VTSAHSSTFSTNYAERVQALNNLIWAKQVEISKFQRSALSYVTPDVGEDVNSNKEIISKNKLKPHGIGVVDVTTNTC